MLSPYHQLIVSRAAVDPFYVNELRKEFRKSTWQCKTNSIEARRAAKRTSNDLWDLVEALLAVAVEHQEHSPQCKLNHK